MRFLLLVGKGMVGMEGWGFLGCGWEKVGLMARVGGSGGVGMVVWYGGVGSIFRVGLFCSGDGIKYVWENAGLGNNNRFTGICPGFLYPSSKCLVMACWL